MRCSPFQSAMKRDSLEEFVPGVEEYLGLSSGRDLLTRLIDRHASKCLQWYVNHYPEQKASLAKFDPLIVAIETRELKAVEKLLATHYMVTYPEGDTVAHALASYGDTALLYQLFKICPALCHAKGANKRHPIHSACWGDHLETIKFILGVDKEEIRAGDDFGSLPIHIACYTGSLAMAKCLAGIRPSELCRPHEDGRRPSHAVCYTGHLNILQYIYSMFPDQLTVADNDGNHPSHWTCIQGHANLLMYIHSVCPTELTAASNDNRHPLHIACYKGFMPIIHFITSLYPTEACLPDKYGQHPIHNACFGGSICTLVYLADLFPAETKALDQSAELPIHKACFQYQFNIIAYLLALDSSQFSMTLSTVPNVYAQRNPCCAILNVPTVDYSTQLPYHSSAPAYMDINAVLDSVPFF